MTVSVPNIRILLLTDSDAFAGTERHMLDLAESLAEQKMTVAVGCPGNSPLAARARGVDIEVIDIPKRGRIDVRAILQLRSLLRHGKINLIHSHNGRTKLISVLAISFAGTGQCVSTQHFLIPNHSTKAGMLGAAARSVHRILDSRLSCKIAISNAVADSARARGDDGRRLRTVLNGIKDVAKVDLLSRSVVHQKSRPVILCAARLEPEKNIHLLIDAVASLRDRGFEVRLDLAGTGRLQAQLMQKVRDLSLDSHIRFLGFQSDVISLMKVADCVVLPSTAEPFGLVLLEAMACGVPVIATRSGGPLEIVEHGVTGFLTEPNDAFSLAQALEKLLSNTELAVNMGTQGRLRYETKFTSRRMAGEISEIYQEIMATGYQSKNIGSGK